MLFDSLESRSWPHGHANGSKMGNAEPRTGGQPGCRQRERHRRATPSALTRQSAHRRGPNRAATTGCT
eukprot:3843489-Prymnesium_polylepis.1